MKIKIPALLFCLTLTLFFQQVNAENLNSQNSSFDYQWSITEQNNNGFSAELSIHDWYIESQDQINDTLPMYLPTIHTMVFAPNGTGIEASLELNGQSERTGLISNELDEDIELVEIGEPAIIKGVRLFPLRIKPFEIDNGYYAVNNRTKVNVRFVEDDNRAPGNNNQINVTHETRKFLEANVLNLDEIDLMESSPLGRILIIVQSDAEIISIMNDYVVWKTQQGYNVEVAPIINRTIPSILNTIRDRYENAGDIPLEYVLIVGDNTGFINMPAYNSLTDHYFTQLEGNDILGDLAIGRFSVTSTTMLRRVVGKTLAYERDVYMADTTWFNNACLTAGAGSGISPIQTNRTIKWMFNQNNIEADTLWFTMGGDIPDFIVNTVNQGASFVNYRGLNGMDDWNGNDNGNFNNGYQLPVVVTITCGTGSFANEVEEAISEGIFRAGIGANTYKGGVVCIGTATLGTHTRFNNIVDSGIFQAPLMYGMRSIGWSLVHGKTRLYEAFNRTNDNQYIDDFSYWNNLMGDPALRMWIGVPRQPEVTHNDVFSANENFLDVSLQVEGGLPEFSWATLSTMVNETDCEIISSKRFNENGEVRLPISNPEDYDTITLTVMGDNLVPYQADIVSQDRDVFVGIYAVTLDDGVGGDDRANPNEDVALNLTVINGGTQASIQYTGTISCDDPRIEILNGATQTIPSLNPGESVDLDLPLNLHIASWAQDKSKPALTLTVAGPEDFESSIFVPVTAWTVIQGEEPYIDDFDGLIYPNETSELVVSVENVGSINATSSMGYLYCENPNVTISQNESAFGLIVAGNSQSNRDDPFEIQLNNLVSLGEKIDFIVKIEDEFGAVDSTACSIYVGDPRGRGPVGPDNYGYWALDNYDNQALFSIPEYDWIEISEIGTELDINDIGDESDETLVIDLPFDFTYYGETFSQASVCSNGWISMGAHPEFITFRNWPIPNPLGPPAILAVFWDDLITHNNGGIYTYYDEANETFIVQWDCRTLSTMRSEVFQVILYNPLAYPTLTGNGKIKFQYNDVQFDFSAQTDNDYGTVGIESPDQLDGVQYVYWNLYSDGAEMVTDNLAILFTDDLRDYNGDATAHITPDEFDLTVASGRTLSDTLFIANQGDGRLNWEIHPVNNELLDDQLLMINGINKKKNKLRSKVSAVQVQTNSNYPPSDLQSQDYTMNKQSVGFPGPSVTFDFGGPDNYGYEWIDSNDPGGKDFIWHTQYGTEITDFGDDPDEGLSPSIDLPFDFDFYGVEYDALVICSNGYITFEDGQEAAWNNQSLPSVNAPRAIIAPWWDDLDLERGGSIYTWDNGVDSLIITFEEILGWNDAGEPARGGPYTFQVLLEANNTITMNYLVMVHEDDTRLDEATIGIQDENATDGLTVLHNNDSYIEDEMTIYIRVPNIWFSLSNYEGMTLPGIISEINLNVNARSLIPGDYAGSVVINTNDEDREEINIPVNLEVVAGGQAPVINEIPDQTTEMGIDFNTLHLDDYVDDPNYDDRWIQWSFAGNHNLHVEIVNRIARISFIDELWSGTEEITFTATNPEELSDSQPVNFIVNYRDLPPTPFNNLVPSNDTTVVTNIVLFCWEESSDPNGGPIKYRFNLATLLDTAQYTSQTNTYLWLSPDTVRLDFESDQNLYWWVEAIDTSASITESNEHYIIRFHYTDVKETASLPKDFSVSEAWPNPFNPTVNIKVGLPRNSEVSLRVMDILGREVDHIKLGVLPAGYQEICWANPKITSGVYFIVVNAGPMKTTRKVMMLK